MDDHLEAQGERRRPRRGRDPGFSLIELMVVVVVIGILVAIAIPAMARLKSRAREATVKANMHTLQTAVEDFAILSTGRYPDNGSDVTDDGRTVRDLCVGAAYPQNPFTYLPSSVVWDADPDPANAGEIGLNPATSTGYVMRASGGSGSILSITLTSGT